MNIGVRVQPIRSNKSIKKDFIRSLRFDKTFIKMKFKENKIILIKLTNT